MAAVEFRQRGVGCGVDGTAAALGAPATKPQIVNFCVMTAWRAN